MKIDDTLPIYTISVAAKLTETPIRMLGKYEKQVLIKPKKIRSRRMFRTYPKTTFEPIKDIAIMPDRRNSDGENIV